MHKPKVLSLAPRICRRLQIPHLLLLAQPIPLSRSGSIPPNIVKFRQRIDEDIHNRESYQLPIASSIQRAVVRPIDVRNDYPAYLHKHVVQSGGNSSGSDGVGVAAAPGNVDGVVVWVGEQSCYQRVFCPCCSGAWDDCQGDHTGKDP